MLVEYVLESKEGGLLESILMPFDVYNDAADHALRALKQRFLYDEIEAEVSDKLRKIALRFMHSLHLKDSSIGHLIWNKFLIYDICS